MHIFVQRPLQEWHYRNLWLPICFMPWFCPEVNCWTLHGSELFKRTRRKWPNDFPCDHCNSHINVIRSCQTLQKAVCLYMNVTESLLYCTAGLLLLAMIRTNHPYHSKLILAAIFSVSSWAVCYTGCPMFSGSPTE